MFKLGFRVDDLPGAIQTLTLEKNRFYNKILSLHLRMIKQLYEHANMNLRNSIRRPQEQGVRSGADPRKKRMTGRFTIGPGGAMAAHLIRDYGKEYGISFVDVADADAATKGIWRVLEWGLKPSPGYVSHPLASEGVHRMPLADPESPDIFMPISPANKPGPGLDAKLFLTNAVEIVEQQLIVGYGKIVREFQPFSRRRIGGRL